MYPACQAWHDADFQDRWVTWLTAIIDWRSHQIRPAKRTHSPCRSKIRNGMRATSACGTMLKQSSPCACIVVVTRSESLFTVQRILILCCRHSAWHCNCLFDSGSLSNRSCLKSLGWLPAFRSQCIGGLRPWLENPVDWRCSQTACDQQAITRLLHGHVQRIGFHLLNAFTVLLMLAFVAVQDKNVCIQWLVHGEQGRFNPGALDL